MISAAKKQSANCPCWAYGGDGFLRRAYSFLPRTGSKFANKVYCFWRNDLTIRKLNQSPDRKHPQWNETHDLIAHNFLYPTLFFPSKSVEIWWTCVSTTTNQKKQHVRSSAVVIPIGITTAELRRAQSRFWGPNISVFWATNISVLFFWIIIPQNLISSTHQTPARQYQNYYTSLSELTHWILIQKWFVENTRLHMIHNSAVSPLIMMIKHNYLHNHSLTLSNANHRNSLQIYIFHPK